MDVGFERVETSLLFVPVKTKKIDKQIFFLTNNNIPNEIEI